MNTAVVLTFPGHFFLTAMTLRSVRYFYPELKQIYILYDDQVMEGWPDYIKDCSKWYKLPFDNFISYSQVNPDIAKCRVGWYRQQMIKCSIDLGVPGDRWFVVDGDIVFDETVDVNNITPVQHRNHSNDPLSLSVIRATKFLLGIDQHPLLADGRFKITSSIPFRILEKSVLEELRRRVESNVGGNFAQCITEMVHAHELVAYDDAGNRMVMHEWEIIEAMNHLMYPGRFQIKDIGSGYSLDKHTAMCAPARFRHGYVYSHQISKSWLENQLENNMVEQCWRKSLDYGTYFDRILCQPI